MTATGTTPRYVIHLLPVSSHGMRTLLFWLILFPFCLLAQQNEEQLAAQYFSNNEFDKAAQVYEKIMQQNPESSYIYENLLTCYLQLKQYTEAEKLVKKMQRRNDDNPFYQVDLGYVWMLNNQPEKAEKIFNELLQKLKGSEQETHALANAFQKRRYTDKAISVYLKSRKLNNSTDLFAVQLAQLYAFKNETAAMMEEYMNVLVWNGNLLEEISGYLQNYLDRNEDFELLRTTLLKRMKAYPLNDNYAELMIWLYVQRKDFDNAFIQARALDKRNKENGLRIIELAQLAQQNEYYDAAIANYQYIISLGKDHPNYANAQAGAIEARKLKIITGNTYTPQDLITLENEYKAFISEYGRYYFTANTIRELARLYAYYLNKRDTAIALFKELIVLPRMEAKFAAECKLELGDIYLLNAEEWEAMLLYGQVDKDYKEDPLGQEAKFRNARLSYYLGEFEWARAQLDVLKTATTQLISNNAIELSLLIQDHTIDSVEEPLKLFARADLLLYQKQYAAAEKLLDSLVTTFPRHTLEGPVLYKKAVLQLRKKQTDSAVALLEQLLKEHGTGIYGDNALFDLASIYEREKNDQAKALDYYTRFLTDYPGSFFTTEVRKRVRTIRGDTIN
ncbi:MAG: tetratricopeptide repeat protein [Bacteroidota bacterium]